MSERPAILIVDDEPAVVAVLRDVFDRYPTCFAADGARTLHQIVNEHPDLVIMDLVLPDVDGLVLLREIRKLSPVPIIVCSARDRQADRVVALRAGADDFVAKPFDVFEIEARVEAVLRRATRPPAQDPNPQLQLGPLTISKWHWQRIGDVAFHLTPIEHKLLITLVERADALVMRSELAELLWGWMPPGIDHLVDVHINRLRAKLRLRTRSPQIITVRGEGYLISE